VFVLLGDKIIEVINKWVTRVVDQRNEKKEQQAANILSCAGKLVYLSRKLEADFLKILSKVNLLTAGSPQQDRDDFIEQLNHFATKTDIIDGIQFWLTCLEEQEIDPKNHEDPIANLIEYANTIRNQAKYSDATPFASGDELLRLLDQAKETNSPAALQRFREAVKTKRGTFDHNVISSMIDEISILTSILRSKYPKLPYPEWIDSVVA
jgi:hypothetical protein